MAGSFFSLLLALSWADVSLVGQRLRRSPF